MARKFTFATRLPQSYYSDSAAASRTPPAPAPLTGEAYLVAYRDAERQFRAYELARYIAAGHAPDRAARYAAGAAFRHRPQFAERPWA